MACILYLGCGHNYITVQPWSRFNVTFIHLRIFCDCTALNGNYKLADLKELLRYME